MAIILVVDDSELQAMLQENQLANAGHTVESVTSGEEALIRIQQLHPEIVVTDMNMPGMDGLALCRALRNDPATKEIMIIVVTATPNDELVVAARRARANYVVSKSDDTDGSQLLNYVSEAEARLRKR